MGYFVRFKEQDNLVYAPDIEDIVHYVECHSTNSESAARRLIEDATYFEVEYDEKNENLVINDKDEPNELLHEKGYGYISWQPLQNLIAVEKKWRVIVAPDTPEDTDVQTGYGR